MRIIPVTRADDPLIAPYAGLRERDLLREGAFIAEGKFILERLLAQHRFRPVSALILESRLEPLRGILEAAPADFAVHVAPPAILNAIAGHDIHRGILALGQLAAGGTADDGIDAVIAEGRPLAAVFGVANGENMGSIMRNAAGLGMGGVLTDTASIHPLARRALRVSMGTALHLPWRRAADAPALLDRLAAEGYGLFALGPAGARALEDIRFPARSAVVFGEEAHGLPPALMARCTGVRIPMAGGVDSLNVAATSAIVFDAIRRALPQGRPAAG